MITAATIPPIKPGGDSKAIHFKNLKPEKKLLNRFLRIKMSGWIFALKRKSSFSNLSIRQLKVEILFLIIISTIEEIDE